MESQRFTAEDAKDAEEERNGSSMEFEHLSFFLCVLFVNDSGIKEEAQRTSSHW